jgi:predicted 2-oxoglutarate/Fe(II)-dependent dioxygenase YbiX
MVNQHSLITDLIGHYKGAIKPELCNRITNSNGYKWSKHQWTFYDTIVDTSNKTNEFDVTYNIDRVSKLIINQAINECLDIYSLQHRIICRSHSNLRINRYSQGHNIDSHYDHITSLFNESKKGIPVLSIVGLLNDNFEGGKFYFWDDYEMDLKQGDIIIFPSIFAYKHATTTVTLGNRWSFVSWAY